MKDLNGFKIDIFNQYGLEVNKKLSTCPLCSADRKPQNQKVKVLMCDWDRGLATCQHCGEVVQLHTYKSKETKKNYKKPEQKEVNLSNKLIKWFAGRGISQHTLRIAKISEGMEWMPQMKKEVNTIQFNYYRNQELINIKYRDGYKNFKLFKDAEKIFYNLDLCATYKEVIIVEGEIDALSYIESGYYNVISIPNGSTIGNVNLDYLDNSIEYFENKDKIYLSLDTDEPGQNVQKELIRRLGAEKCYITDLNGFKDANELLCANGKESLKNSIENAKEIPIDGVSSVKDWQEQFEEYLINGMNQGFITGMKSFDNIFSTYTGQYIVVTGKPSCFVKNQKIITKKGYKEISKLEKNDFVLSYNENTKTNEYRRVINTMVNEKTKDKIYRITMKDGTKIECTENHKFFTGKSYVKIKDLLLSLNKFKI